MHWTVVIQMPVMMELNGLSSNASAQLRDAAQAAMAYISGHVHTHTHTHTLSLSPSWSSLQRGITLAL